MKFVVYDTSDNPISVHDTEAQSVAERDKQLGRKVMQREDNHPDVVLFDRKVAG